jgi:hypothetical protein
MLFGTLLTKNGIFVYDTSNPGNEDRFPQSWAIARSKNINIQENDITSKFAILYKIGDILSIKDYYDVPENSCPGIDTADDIKNLKFNSITLASDSGNTMQDYASQIGIMLGLYGTSGSSNGWLIIMHKSDSAGSTGIYYTKDRPLQGEKLGCLIIRQLSEKYPDIKVSSTLADDAMGKEVLDKISNTNELKGYNLWIIIQLSEEDSQSIDQSALSSLVKDALGEYYGSKTQG